MNTDETIIEQIPKSLRNFSSQYGSNNTRSYAVENICTVPEIYPLYGDSTNALVFRTYGPWWINMPSYKENKNRFLRQESEFTSRDFIEIEYANSVSQCISLNIYETYNPGSLEVVYVGKEETNGLITWHQVWKFPEPFSIILRNNEEIFIKNGKNFY
jgi:F-box/leucine-rich repeat protein 4